MHLTVFLSCGVFWHFSLLESYPLSCLCSWSHPLPCWYKGLTDFLMRSSALYKEKKFSCLFNVLNYFIQVWRSPCAGTVEEGGRRETVSNWDWYEHCSLRFLRSCCACQRTHCHPETLTAARAGQHPPSSHLWCLSSPKWASLAW